MLPSNHIRIVDLLPADADDLKAPIKCVTRVVALSDEPIYEALSYRWGTDRGRRFITVGGQLTSVTASLHAALFRLRLNSEKRSLWIDQICINQEDTDEKASQIRLMRHIYSHCTRCLVWLDELESSITLDDAQGALEICDYLADRSLRVPSCFQSPAAVLGATRALSSIGPKEHPWWHRLWTAQESILPSSKRLMWGPLELEWDVLDQWASTKTTPWVRWESDSGDLTGTGKSEAEINGTLNECLNVLGTNVMSVNNANQGSGPISTIVKWGRRNASNPQDKVFGLLGLLPPDMPMPHTDKCNHKTPANQVYRAFTLDVMLYTGTLEPLIIEPRTSPGTPGMSRWAIDMRCVSMFSVDPYYRILGCGKGKYDACAGRKLDMATLLETAAVPEYHGRVLGLSGVMVDTVEVIGAENPKLLSSQMPAFEKIAAVLRGWMEMARRFQERLDGALDGDKFEEAFYRVLVGDSIRDGNKNVERRPNREDLAAVSEFVKTGSGLINGMPSWPEYVGNQTFFVTKSGMMGMGHWDTEPGDEIWIFDGGAMPFTIRPRKGARTTDFDFVGCCYAHNIMRGEGYKDEIMLADRREVHLY